MTQYFNDFTQYPLATKLDSGSHDFAVLLGQTDYTFQVAEDARGVSGRVLRIHRGGYTGYTWWSWGAVPVTGSGEIYIEDIAGLAANAAAEARTGAARLLCNANAGVTQGYYGADVQAGSDNVTPSIRRADSPATTGAAGTFYAFQTNRKRSYLLKWTDLGSSVDLKYKTWWSDEAEPAAWSVETTSATMGAGAPYWADGVIGFGRTESGGVESRIAFIGVGTGTDSAPRAPSGGSDTSAPTLTSPTATATGTTTASGSVTTDEANGTLYYLASANATELVATVKAGSSQAVTATGAQNVTVTGLTASTSYYLHFVHTDAAANDSAVATSAQFTTSAANTSPSFTGPNIADISGTEAVALTPVDVSASFFDSESGLTFSAIGSWPAGVTVSSAGVVSGTPTTAGTYSGLQVRATDAGSLTADSNAFTITVAAPGDAENPTLTGAVTFASITQTGYTAQWPAGSDNVAVAGYEYQIGSTAGAWTDAGNNLSAAITGRTEGTTETVYVRAYDAAGLRSTPAISGSVTLLSASTDGTITVGSALYPIKYTSASVLNESGLRATVLDATTLAEVLNTSGVVCTNGVITITDAALVIGNTYHLAVKTANGWLGVSDGVTAS